MSEGVKSEGGNLEGGKSGGRRRPARERGRKPRAAAVKEAASEKMEEHVEAGGEGEMCLVCADDIVYAAHYPCQHFTCHKCAVRMRALMKNKSCLICRTPQDSIVVSKIIDKAFLAFPAEDLVYKDDKLGILYDSKEGREEVNNLLKFNCPAKDCTEVLLNWRDLRNHVRKIHERNLCDLCCKHKHVFTVELPLYTHNQLIKHEKEGDKEGFRGHPQCEFCRTRFYSGDELFTHCREKHEKCFVCERLNPGNPQYYKNYDTLEKHFQDKHYACTARSCLDKKFVVFGTAIELQDHMATEHPEIVGKGKSARRIEPTFNSTRGRRGEFQGQLSTVSADATAAASLVNNSTGSSNGAYHGGFETPEEAFPELGASRPVQAVQMPATTRGQQLAGNNNREMARKRIDERARIYLNYDAAKFSQFKELLERFESNSASPKTVVAESVRLFESASITDLRVLVHEIAAQYAITAAKNKELNAEMKAYEERRAFPSLGGAKSKPVIGTSANWGGRPSNSRRVDLSSSAAFPSLPGAKPKSPSPVVQNNSAAKRFAVRESASSSASSSTSSVTGITNRMNMVTLSRPSSSSNLQQNEFPSLPKSKIKRHPPVRPPPELPNPSQWGQKPAPVSLSTDGEPDLAAAATRKGKKKVLYRIGI
ncbi:E3 ubiquitin-protein ligase Hel2p [Trichomonascus vanleenenianus]|uniref:E3 ubiquitin-protein ligase HEL2 n=1 Tax=Trichomonascus vanleenenianus TaxID=2268995 RepID=UPI003ECB43AE